MSTILLMTVGISTLHVFWNDVHK